MKQLFWKEYRELRFVPLAALLMYLAIIAIGLRIHSHLNIAAYIASIFVTCITFWVYAGATSFSNEIHSGTLQFMSVLPVSRPKLWWVKLASTAAVSIATFVSVLLVCTVAIQVMHPPGFMHIPVHQSLSLTTREFLEVLFCITVLMVGCFSAGMCASPFCYRPITSTVAAFVGGALYVSYVVSLFDKYTYGHMSHRLTPPDLLHAVGILALACAPYLLTSYQTFTRGESLKTIRRFKVGGLVAAGSLACTALILIAGHSGRLW